MWSDAWVGLPYAELGRGPDAYDCLGLYLAVYAARFGVAIPDPAITRIGSARQGRAWRAIDGLGAMVEQAQEGDALLFLMGGRSLHIGYALNGRDMLHLECDQALSCIEVWRSTRWLGRLKGIYRHAG